MKILLVEDSERLCRSIGVGLTNEGHAVDIAVDGEQGLEFAEIYEYDVIILDLMLPKIDGLTVLKRLRRNDRPAHVLILSARDQTETRVAGLDLGADDYMVKPFSFDELKARIRALYRRGAGQKHPRMTIGPLTVDTNTRTVRVEGVDSGLTAKEYALLEFLGRRKNRVHSQQNLIESLYNSDQEPVSNVIEALVCSIRRKLLKLKIASPIKNRRGQGYFVE